MPAYFSLSIQFKRSNIYSTFMTDLHNALSRAGVKFRSGETRGFENMMLEEISRWNQSKLEENFELGAHEHFKHNYRQAYFCFNNFSEVRGFLTNNSPKDGSFTYHIIIPEDDVLENGYPIKFKADAIGPIIELAKSIWQFSPVEAVQTALEADPCAIDADSLKEGEPPYMRPFAITKDYGHEFSSAKFTVEKLTAGRNGLFFMLRTDQLSKPQ